MNEPVLLTLHLAAFCGVQVIVAAQMQQAVNHVAHDFGLPGCLECAGVLHGLRSLASELTSQYRITYTLPAGAKRSERLTISVRRKDLIVRGPEKLPT